MEDGRCPTQRLRDLQPRGQAVVRLGNGMQIEVNAAAGNQVLGQAKTVINVTIHCHRLGRIRERRRQITLFLGDDAKDRGGMGNMAARL